MAWPSLSPRAGIAKEGASSAMRHLGMMPKHGMLPNPCIAGFASDASIRFQAESISRAPVMKNSAGIWNCRPLNNKCV